MYSEVSVGTYVVTLLNHEDALFLFQMKTADAITHVAALSARYKFMLS